MGKLHSVAELESLRARLLAAPDRPVVRVCLGPGCLAQGADKVSQAFKAAIQERHLAADVKPLIKETGCHGFCSQGTLVNLYPHNLFYVQVKPQDVPDIVDQTLREGKVVERLLYSDNGNRYQSAAEVPFYKLQQKVILKNVGLIDPLDIDDALKAGAYRSLVKVLSQMSPDEIIDTVTVAGLRGRGGGGFPTGFKWRKVVENARENPGPVFIVANGDEGDPGAFMDRAIMEGDPHAVLEGMAIGARAMGAEQGYLYVRAEYPFAVRTLQIAIEQARSLGLLGRNILGTGFNFDVHISRGAGAFVCGEETALLASIEGRVGEPVTRPPYPVEEGLWDRPTVINNVETWANVPYIIDHGAQFYAKVGVPHSTGTKIFSLVGKVKNSGLVEVPMGVTLGSIVEEIGGGVPGATRFKAVQTGGPSGGIIPYELKELPPEELKLDKVGLQPRGLYAHGAQKPARGLRLTGPGRLHHGLRRHDRHGRPGLRGGRGPVLPPLSRGRVLRQVPALPPGHQGHAGVFEQFLPGQGGPGRHRCPGKPGQGPGGRVAVRPGPHRPQPGPDQHPLLPG